MDAFRLFRGRLSHSRRKPVMHSFAYNFFQLRINLNRLEELNSISRWWSTSRFNLVRFNRKNYLPSDKPLLDEVSATIKAQTGQSFNGEVFLIANLSYWGHCYNPVSFYACYQHGVLCFLVSEVHNTPWGERFSYVHDIRAQPPDDKVKQGEITVNNRHEHVATFQKQFHVSPFMPMHLRYEWRYRLNEENIKIIMNLYDDSYLIFNSTMDLKGVTLDTKTANKLPFLYPFVTLRVLLAIYWQALKLYAKRVPFYSYPKM